MWRTNPNATETNPRALAGKILEKGWNQLTEKEKKTVESQLQEIVLLLPKAEAEALLDLHKTSGQTNATPPSLGKTKLISKIKTKAKEKRSHPEPEL